MDWLAGGLLAAVVITFSDIVFPHYEVREAVDPLRAVELERGDRYELDGQVWLVDDADETTGRLRLMRRDWWWRALRDLLLRRL